MQSVPWVKTELMSLSELVKKPGIFPFKILGLSTNADTLIERKNK